MLTAGIKLKNFKNKNKGSKLQKLFLNLIREDNEILNSLKKSYKNSFSKKQLNKFKKSYNFKVIGMGGSSLGSQAIFDFLRKKIDKNFRFIDNLQPTKNHTKGKKYTNLIISKSGETIETIINANIFIKKNDNNIFVTENKKNYLYLLAQKLKGEIIHHNNFIGGRYSVLSEVGMLPAELMGLNVNNFRQFNSLIKNQKFINALIVSVASTLNFIKQKFNSIIINYDERSENLFKWYQQLIAESLGKKKGFYQLYLLCQKIIIVLCNFILMVSRKIFLLFFM